MASKTKRKEILEQLGINKEDMKSMYRACIRMWTSHDLRLYVNPKTSQIMEDMQESAKQDGTWKDLPGKILRQIPDLYTKLADAEIAYNNDCCAELSGQENVQSCPVFQDITESATEKQMTPTQYCRRPENSTWHEEMLAKIDAGEDLTKQEFFELYGQHNPVWTKEDSWDNPRFYEGIVNICGRHFLFKWKEEETGYYEVHTTITQPYEVCKREYPETVIRTEWVPIDKEREIEGSQPEGFSENAMNPPEEYEAEEETEHETADYFD